MRERESWNNSFLSPKMSASENMPLLLQKRKKLFFYIWVGLTHELGSNDLPSWVMTHARGWTYPHGLFWVLFSPSWLFLGFGIFLVFLEFLFEYLLSLSMPEKTS